jgi:hypothetical protein
MIIGDNCIYYRHIYNTEIYIKGIIVGLIIYNTKVYIIQNGGCSER